MTIAKPTRGASKEILLVEASSMIGSIILSTANQLQLQPLRLVSNCHSAQVLLDRQAFGGLIISLDDAGAALNIIHELRQGRLRCASSTPVAVTTAQCDADMASRIKALNVQRILLKPFKIRDLITTIQMLA